MHKIYLDTCVAIKPFQETIDAAGGSNGHRDRVWHAKRINKSKELITLIGHGSLKWSTSGYFLREFYGLTKANTRNRAAIESSTELRGFLRETYKLARQAHLIKASADIEVDAEELTYLSAIEYPAFRLDYSDSCHIIASFRAEVDRFFTYDYKSILNRHKDFITNRGKEFNPDYRCEDPAASG